MDYTAVGDTTNIAARLQQTADRGRVLVSEATHRLVEGYFHTRSLGGLELKGKAEPVRAWEIIAARQPRTRLDVGLERGLTPYVGRERELRSLFESFEKAKAGHGQVVFVVGEAGIGCGSGSWGGRCPSLADYVIGTGATRGATAAGQC